MANDSWIKSKSNQFLSVAALIIPVGYCLNACNGPKIYPVTQSVEDVKRENNRRIKASPVLQEIDQLCVPKRFQSLMGLS